MNQPPAKRFLMLAVLLIGFHFKAQAEPVSPMTTECLMSAAQQYGIHPDILLAILIVEGGTVGKNSRSNDNGSYDIGPFQINSIHIPTLNGFGIDEVTLRNNGCVNTYVAAWHLNRVMTPEVISGITDNESYLRAIARYHSVTPRFNQRYANRLRSAFEYLYRERNQ